LLNGLGLGLFAAENKAPGNFSTPAFDAALESSQLAGLAYSAEGERHYGIKVNAIPG